MIKRSQESISINRLYNDFEQHRAKLNAEQIADYDMLQDVAQMVSASSRANISHDKLSRNQTSWKDLYQSINLYLDSDAVKSNFKYCDFGTFVLDELLKSYNDCYYMNSLISKGHLTNENAGIWKLAGLVLTQTFSSTEEAQEYFNATKSLVEKVITMGADVGKTISGLTCPDPQIAKQSLENGADVNAILPNGDPVLSRIFDNTLNVYASDEDRLNVICDILNHNPDLSLMDSNGESIEQHKNKFETSHKINLSEYMTINSELSDLTSPKTEHSMETETPASITTDEGKV